MNRERLRRALDELETEGTLDAESRGRVEARLATELRPERERSVSVAGIVASLGVLLVATGVVHFVATHWEEIPKTFKLAGMVSLLLGFHHFGYRLAHEPGTWPRLGTAFTAGGVLLFGAALAVVGQLYHLESTPHGLLLWWGLNLPIVFLSRSRVVLATVALLLSIWTLWQTIDWLAARDLDRDETVLCALAVVASAHAALFAGLAGLAEGTGGSRRGWPKAAPWLRTFAVPAAFLSLYALSFHDVFDADDSLDGRLFLPGLVLGAVALPALVAAWRRGATADAVEGGAMLALGGLEVLLLTFAPGRAWIGLNLLLFAGLVLLVTRGARLGRPEAVNLGLTGVFVLVVTRYFELLAERLRHGFLAFLGAGVLLIGLGVVLEWRRRALLRRAREVRS